MSKNSTGSSADALPFDAGHSEGFDDKNLEVPEARLRASMSELESTIKALKDAQIVTSEVLALEFSV